MFKLKSFFKIAVLFAVLLLSAELWAKPAQSPFGADAVPDLYAPNLAGEGGFTTTTGGAPASAINPAQGGDARRMIFDFGYLAIPDFNNKEGYLQSIELGALFPTKYGVFCGSIRYIGGFDNEKNHDHFPIGNTFSGNFSAAKEIYPGMSLGAGINFGFGADWTAAADLGFYYNKGNLGPFKNFTWAVVIGGLGKSYFPTWLTPAGGVSLDLVHVDGKDGKKDPFALNTAVDLSFPSLFYPEYANMIAKAGLKMTIAELVTISASWPGGSGLNIRELKEKFADFPAIPSVGLGVNIVLPSSGERIAGGRLPSDGDLKVNGAFKPLYNGVTAVGGGVSWYVGVADTKPPVIGIQLDETPYFSPNNDGNSDYLEIPVSITDANYVVSWSLEIKDEDGEVVRVIGNKEQHFDTFSMKDIIKRLFTAKKQIDIPSVITWDGIRSSGVLAPDGKYFFTITATDDSGNTDTSPVHEAVLKNTPPSISINAMTDAQKIFNPKGEGAKDNVTFVLHGSDEEAWESGIYNSAGEKIRTFETESGEPKQRVWDGRDDSGNIAPDGVYVFKISATDRAKNSASADMNNIILDAREAGAFLTSSVSAIAPKPDQSTGLVDFTIRLLLQDGIDNWKLALKDKNGEAVRTFSGAASVPAVQSWNGLDEQGAVKEGVFTPELTVTYTKGDVVKAAATTVTVDVSGPELSLVSSPEYFSPDNDGEDDELIISLSAIDASPIANWSIEIREPEPPYNVFRRFEGRGSPAGRIIWDGKSDKGELVQSATDYPYTFRAEDILGNSSSMEGKFGVDVLVIRDGDRLRILIPSIVFRPDHADFNDLPKDTVDNNIRILRRIAQILNKFRDYKVQVEGHANATQPAGPMRDREEPKDKRISEERAKAVVDQLVKFGVARSRLYYLGVGTSSPVVPFEDKDNWWKNRRVEFILIK